MPSGHYDRERTIGIIAIKAAREWIAQPDYAYRNLMAGGKYFAEKHGISLTSINRARVIVYRDEKLADAVSGGQMSLHGATQELVRRGEASLRDPPQLVPYPAPAAGEKYPSNVRKSVTDDPDTPSQIVQEPVADGLEAVTEAVTDDRLQRLIAGVAKRMAELAVAIERLTARQNALERRLERDEKDGVALQELAVKAIGQSKAAANDVLRLEAEFAKVIAAGTAMSAASAGAIEHMKRLMDGIVKSGVLKSDFPKGWRHLSEKKREEWRNGKADKG